jgi:hypothetical protein
MRRRRAATCAAPGGPLGGAAPSEYHSSAGCCVCGAFARTRPLRHRAAEVGARAARRRRAACRRSLDETAARPVPSSGGGRGRRRGLRHVSRVCVSRCMRRTRPSPWAPRQHAHTQRCALRSLQQTVIASAAACASLSATLAPSLLPCKYRDARMRNTRRAQRPSRDARRASCSADAGVTRHAERSGVGSALTGSRASQDQHRRQQRRSAAAQPGH